MVTAERIADGALRSLADVLRYVPGVTIGQGEGNTDQIAIRGQVTTASFFSTASATTSNISARSTTSPGSRCSKVPMRCCLAVAAVAGSSTV
ncbi:TonB-dependent receptor plug domain-containing protein [Sphingomonas sp. TX0543]|uniref:TonB-dependent receptor plug domain-containing protein n=1 Tax=Sphingomonas sp. TX0543 TaxID=3399682 RepID=UPI003AFA8770